MYIYIFYLVGLHSSLVILSKKFLSIFELLYIVALGHYLSFCHFENYSLPTSSCG